ncbi:MAG: hypothetical protein CV087_17350 [Candidatus Brocadia sp. WS118]|nr:MAG: hypothetical protein CV087_17350 [Candidatus Brocadia sp. WS118]
MNKICQDSTGRPRIEGTPFRHSGFLSESLDFKGIKGYEIPEQVRNDNSRTPCQQRTNISVSLHVLN